jgi:hypothetical protein
MLLLDRLGVDHREISWSYSWESSICSGFFTFLHASSEVHGRAFISESTAYASVDIEVDRSCHSAEAGTDDF